jgi:hypothetical protein
MIWLVSLSAKNSSTEWAECAYIQEGEERRTETGMGYELFSYRQRRGGELKMTHKPVESICG